MRTTILRRGLAGVLLLATLFAAGGCVCRPGFIGPYGGRPPRCFVL